MSELKINIIPCLQERKKIAALSKFEPEQNASTIGSNTEEEKKIGQSSLTKMRNTSALMNNIWSNKNKLTQANFFEFYKNKIMTNALSIPDFFSHGFTSACKNLSCSEKWTMYMKFFLLDENQYKTNFMLFTHHNRIRGLKDYKDEDALIPFINGATCDAYANAFCLKITVEEYLNKKVVITFGIIFDGFGDQSKYTYCSSAIKKKYEDGIDKEKIENGLNEALGILPFKQKKINIYVIRHGNALHNKPVNAQGSLRLDSPLTPLGMWQAYQLGKKIVEKEKEAEAAAAEKKEATKKDKITLGNVVLCCSFLKRTWLTCLYCLSGILAQQNELLAQQNEQLPKHLKKFMILLTNNAINKFLKTKYSKEYLSKIDKNIIALTLIENIRKLNKEKESWEETFKTLFTTATPTTAGGKRTRKKRKRKKTRKKVYVKRKRRKTRKK